MTCAGSRPGGVPESRWLGRLDSNQGSRDQNPLPYRLATPHHGASGRPPQKGAGTEERGTLRPIFRATQDRRATTKGPRRRNMQRP